MRPPHIEPLRARILAEMSRGGIPLAFEHVTDNEGWRMVFAAQDTLEVRITRESHAWLIAGHGSEPYATEAVARAVAR